MIEKSHSFTHEGVRCDVYTLTNRAGAAVDILTYGGRITRLMMPDRAGSFDDLTVGCAAPEDYLGPNPYFGALIGRYGNRIEQARFTLGGKTYRLSSNDGAHSLHGGTSGFDRKVWSARVQDGALALSLVSPDGEGGYPGNLTVTVTYTLTEDNALIIDYEALSDADTVLNLTNHTYFNLGGRAAETVLDQRLTLLASRVTPVDDTLIPHGDFLDVTGTPFDFRQGKRLGEDMFADDPMIRGAGGYDINYCVDGWDGSVRKVAELYDPTSGRVMECATDLPGVQLYTGCRTGGFQGKRSYVNHCAVCLETQYFPNTPNCPSYPSCACRAGERYRSRTCYRFSVR